MMACLCSDYCSLQYASIDQAVAKLLSSGPGSLMAKIDVEHAYRNITVHPDDRYLLGMKWENETFVDCVTIWTKIGTYNFLGCSQRLGIYSN